MESPESVRMRAIFLGVNHSPSALSFLVSSYIISENSVDLRLVSSSSWHVGPEPVNDVAVQAERDLGLRRFTCFARLSRMPLFYRLFHLI